MIICLTTKHVLCNKMFIFSLNLSPIMAGVTIYYRKYPYVFNVQLAIAKACHSLNVLDSVT